MTDGGRLKVANAENGSVTNKSNMSKASPSPFIWTLPDLSLMSSPIPHTYQCGMDQTLDTDSQTKNTHDSTSPETNTASNTGFQVQVISEPESGSPGALSNDSDCLADSATKPADGVVPTTEGSLNATLTDIP